MKKSLTMGGKIGAQNLKSQEPEPRAKSQELARAKSQERQEPRAKPAKSRKSPRAKSTIFVSRRPPTPGASARTIAAAALACAALLGFSATAQAQTDVLSATLTVKDLGTSQVGCANTTPSARCSDFLSEDEFTYDSTDYAVTALFVRPSGSLVLGFNADLTTAAQTLTLDVAGTTFAFEDAETKTTAVRIWSNSGLSWSVDDPVVVKLVEPAPTVPGAPVLTATANGETQIDLSWTVPDTGGRALDKYSIDVSADGGTTWGPQADVGSAITTYSHTGLTGGTTRHYRVAAVNPIGTGAWSNVDSATTEAAAVANNPATGSPVITGTAQVGQSLYASLGSVADADGPSIIVASYQWIRVDGATETDITGATTTPYTPVADDVGKQLKVRLSFTDDLGNPESRTSAATQAVLAAAGANNAPVFTDGNQHHAQRGREHGGEPEHRDRHRGDGRRWRRHAAIHPGRDGHGVLRHRLDQRPAPDPRRAGLRDEVLLRGDGLGLGRQWRLGQHQRDHHRHGCELSSRVGHAGGADGGRDRELGHEPGRELDGTGPQRRPGHHRLQPAIPAGHHRILHERPADTRQRHERDDHGPDCGHVVSGAGAGAERRNAQRLVPCGNRQHEFDGPTDTYPRGWSQSLQRGRWQRPDLCGTERAQQSTHHGSGGHRGRHGDGSGRLRRA